MAESLSGFPKLSGSETATSDASGSFRDYAADQAEAELRKQTQWFSVTLGSIGDARTHHGG